MSERTFGRRSLWDEWRMARPVEFDPCPHCGRRPEEVRATRRDGEWTFQLQPCGHDLTEAEAIAVTAPHRRRDLDLS